MRRASQPLERAARFLLLTSIVGWAVACGSSRSAEPAVPPPTLGVDAPPPTVRCPAQALALVVDVPALTSETATAIELDAGGQVRTPLAAGPVGRIDQRGCLIGGDQVWVDWTAGDTLWTLRDEPSIAGNRLQLSAGRSLEITDDGAVVTYDAQGAREPSEWGALRFPGYRTEHRCVAFLLLQAYLSMMPSMAVVDGNPRELPPPADSACPELHTARREEPTL